eukprot:UN19477
MAMSATECEFTVIPITQIPLGIFAPTLAVRVPSKNFDMSWEGHHMAMWWNAILDEDGKMQLVVSLALLKYMSLGKTTSKSDIILWRLLD